MGQWLTPDSFAACRGYAVYFPDDTEARQIFAGALLLLAEAYNWEEFGDLTPEEAAAVWSDVLIDFEAGKGRVMAIGDIYLRAATDADQWSLPCDGQEVAEADYPELFAVIGDTFGSSGVGLFNVPDLASRVPVGTGQGPGLTQRDLADVGGQETHQLTIPEMPSHRHAASTGIFSGGGGLLFGRGDAPGAIRFTDYTGGATAHENMPPFLALAYFIVAK